MNPSPLPPQLDLSGLSPMDRHALAMLVDGEHPVLVTIRQQLALAKTRVKAHSDTHSPILCIEVPDEVELLCDNAGELMDDALSDVVGSFSGNDSPIYYKLRIWKGKAAQFEVCPLEGSHPIGIVEYSLRYRFHAGCNVPPIIAERASSSGFGEYSPEAMAEHYSLTKLERAVLDLCLVGDCPRLEVLRQQAARATVSARMFTGVGFFTSLEVPPDCPILDHPKAATISDLGAEMERVRYGVGFVLFIDDGKLNTIEGFTYADPWPEEIGVYSLQLLEIPRKLWSDDAKREQ